MLPLAWVIAAILALCVGQVSAATTRLPNPIAPKVMIISMFAPEAAIWYTNLPSTGLGNLLSLNISTPGLSPLDPHIHCTADKSICQLTTGESEINAAASLTALVLSPSLDLRKTYFLLAGIAGVNPKLATLGSVALARYAVQVGLQYELDAREMPADWGTGYVAFGTKRPGEYPSILYGTEVMEVNSALRDIAFNFALRAELKDNQDARAYRERYRPEAKGKGYVAALAGPGVVKCDAATSDVYYSAAMLSEAFENVTALWTNGTGRYCMTAQEDNASLEVLVRMAVHGLVDFGRVVVMRTGSNFDRPPPGVTAYEHLFELQQNGFPIAIENLFRAGVEIVKGILKDWDRTFEKGVPASNYIGDIFGTLSGQPDFGPGSLTDGKMVSKGGLAHAPKVWQ